MDKQTLEEKINYCAGLIGRSALDDVVRNVLLEKLSVFEESILDSLIESLEREQVELEKLSREMKAADRPLDQAWKEVEKKQEEVIHDATDKFIAGLIRDRIELTEE